MAAPRLDREFTVPGQELSDATVSFAAVHRNWQQLNPPTFRKVGRSTDG